MDVSALSSTAPLRGDKKILKTLYIVHVPVAPVMKQTILRRQI